MGNFVIYILSFPFAYSQCRSAFTNTLYCSRWVEHTHTQSLSCMFFQVCTHHHPISALKAVNMQIKGAILSTTCTLSCLTKDFTFTLQHVVSSNELPQWKGSTNDRVVFNHFEWDCWVSVSCSQSSQRMRCVGCLVMYSLPGIASMVEIAWRDTFQGLNWCQMSE